MSSNTRKLKTDLLYVPKNKTVIDPLTLNFVTTKVPTIITNFYFKDGKLSNQISADKIFKTSKEELSSIMEIPPMGLDISSLIDLYKVEYIDDLTEWVINSIGDAKPFTTINRVINTWIKVNWTKIKKYNNGLEKIFIVLMRYAIDSDVLKNIKLDKEVKEFIDFWVEKHDDDEFIFNLGEDMIKYLLKK